MQTKLKAKDIALEAVEMVKQEFPTSQPSLQEIKNIFSEVSFGEITFKIINGEIESIQVTKNYRPISLDNE